MIFNICNGVEHAQNSFGCFRQFREEGLLCDVILEAISVQNDIVRISAHRIVLAAEIPYFKVMFGADMRESTQKSIFIKSIQADTLQAVVAYAYGENINVPEDRVYLLLVAADMFHMESLLKKCCMCYQRLLHPDNYLEIRFLADTFNCPDLSEACLNYARANFVNITSRDNYLSFSFKELEELLSSDKTLVIMEEQVYLAVLKWVYHNLEKRRKYVTKLLSHVRFPFLSLECLYKIVEKEQLVQNEQQCLIYLQEAYTYKNCREKCGLLKECSRLKPRKWPGIDDMFVTVGGKFEDTKFQTKMEKYDPIANNWTILGETVEPKYGLCACYHKGYIYVIGGSVNNDFLNNLERYSIIDEMWETMMPMKEPRMSHSACILYGIIYVTGGGNQNGFLSSTERYKPESNCWEELAPMNYPRINHGMTVVGSYLFVAGGNVGPIVFNSAEYYDPSKDIWTLVSPMSVPRFGLGVASIGNTVYVVGGIYRNEQYKSVESYNLKNDKWDTCAPLNVSRSYMGLVKYNDTLYACGGNTVKKVESSMEKYKPGSKSWEYCASMRADKTYFGMIAT